MNFELDTDALISFTTLNDDGEPASPTGVKFHTKSPSATVTTYILGTDPNVTESVTGKEYECIVDLDEPGLWYIRAEALNVSDQTVGAVETSVFVNSSKVI